jgi:hypothetical protein
MSENNPTILDDPSSNKEPEESKGNYERQLQSVMMFSFAVFFIGWLFKIQHWNYSGPLLIISLSTLSFSGLLRYSLKRKKQIEDYLLMMVYSVLPIAFLFQLMHWQGSNAMLIAGGIAFFLYFTVRLVKSLRKKNNNN